MLSPCLGREDAQRALHEALEESRWVTVVGPPGSGKTLLVRHVAAAAAAAASWVDARNLRTIDDVLVAALESLDSETAPGDSLTGALGRAVDGRECLLVLDGLDLDSTAAGPVLQSILEATSDARVVVTALTTARQPAETVVRVGPLPVPAPRAPLEGPAVELFLRRIRAAGGQQVDLAEQAHEVRRLLRATGGLPLLIEQVAVQSALVGLSNAMSAVSLDQAVDSAHDLLDEASATALRRIGLLDFHVGLGVLAHVLDASVPETAELAGNLVRRSLLEVDARGHFDMLSPIRGRARALARPDDVAAVRAGLLAWAETHAPAHDNYGAADAEWLGDLPAMRHAVLTACAEPETRAHGYSVANRIFSSLYTSMRAREAVEILEGALASGDGPPAMGAQIARRAGIAASEVRGTYEGLWLLDRADQHASSAPRPEEQLSKTASIRAEMHLDAGDLASAEIEARRAIDLDPDGSITRQATRTLADVYASQGRFAEATEAAVAAMPARTTGDERWIDLSLRTVLARIALEQGRIAEAVAGTRAVVVEARELAEDRVGLLATLLRNLDRRGCPPTSYGRRCPGPSAFPCSPRTGATCWPGGTPSELPDSPPTWSPWPTPPGWAATRSTPACSSAARWSTSATSTRPRRRTSPPSTTATPCASRCAPPTCSTASPGWRGHATCPRRGRSPQRPSRSARRARPPAGATPPTTTWCRPKRAPRSGSTATTCRPTRSRSSRPSSAGPRPRDRRCSTRSPRPSARSPSGWPTGSPADRSPRSSTSPRAPSTRTSPTSTASSTSTPAPASPRMVADNR